MVDDLSGKTVLLTGASTGLGPHIARRLREAGAKFVLSARNEAALEKLADEGRFRKEFNLVGTPLRIEMKTSKNPYADKDDS